jgi:hypothetical protein
MFLHVYHLTHMSEIHISTLVHITVQIRVGRSYVDFKAILTVMPFHFIPFHLIHQQENLPPQSRRRITIKPE